MSSSPPHVEKCGRRNNRSRIVRLAPFWRAERLAVPFPTACMEVKLSRGLTVFFTGAFSWKERLQGPNFGAVSSTHSVPKLVSVGVAQ